tara:strand:+ start:1847 stop:2587 length:741 start_codon:yes stop_codon:yes gene_type:complete
MLFSADRIDLFVNYHTISTKYIRRYLDHLRRGVVSFPATDYNKHAMDDLVASLEKNWTDALRGKRILDIGCGDGYTLSRIRDKGISSDLLGISVNRDDVALAKKMTGIKVKFGDMHSIPMPEGSVDALIVRHCLEHSPMPLFALFEMHRVLKATDGLLVVVLPANTPFWVEYEGHFHCMPKENWRKLFREAGFDVAAEENGTWYAKSTDAHEEEWRFFLRPREITEGRKPHTSIYREVIDRIVGRR